MESKGCFHLVLAVLVLLTSAAGVFLFLALRMSQAPPFTVSTDIGNVSWVSEYVQRGSTPVGGVGLYAIEVPDFSTTSDSEELAELREKMKRFIGDGNCQALAVAYRDFRRLGVPFNRRDFEPVLNSISRGSWNWGPGRGPERVALWEPLVDPTKGTDYEYQIKAEYAIGLMESGQREAALRLWNESRMQIESLWDNLKNDAELASLQTKRRLEQALGRFGIALVSSRVEADRLEGVLAAKAQFERAQQTTRLTIEANNKIIAPHVKARAEEIFNDAAFVCFTYCLYESGLGANSDLNPWKTARESSLRFKEVSDTGLPNSARIALGDIDHDGFCDVFLPGSGLFKNLSGSGRFEPWALDMTIRGQAGAMADLNNDGRLDVVAVSGGHVATAMQTADAKFQCRLDVAETAAENPEGLGLFDGDGDGLLDLYLASHETKKVGEGTNDVVLRNRGDGTFEDVTSRWGFADGELDWCGRGVSPADFDHDGLTDVFVSNYRLGPNLLWRRNGNELHYRQVAADPFAQPSSDPGHKERELYAAGSSADVGVEGFRISERGKLGSTASTWGHTIGSAWGDIDNNGWQDLVCANLAHPRFIADGWSDITRVYLNDGQKFVDQTQIAGIRFRETHSDPLLADFDNDGDLDLSITCTYPYFISQTYENNGRGQFTDVTWNCGAVAGNTFGQAAGDFDNDGDVDWFVCDGNRGVRLFQNQCIDAARAESDLATERTGALKGFIKFQLRPDPSESGSQKNVNALGIGCRVTIEAGGQKYMRELHGGRGSSSFDDSTLHFGLGDFTGRVNATVFWGHGRTSILEGLEINRIHKLSTR